MNVKQEQEYFQLSMDLSYALLGTTESSNTGKVTVAYKVKCPQA